VLSPFDNEGCLAVDLAHRSRVRKEPGMRPLESILISPDTMQQIILNLNFRSKTTEVIGQKPVES
jgi:hypothetical protein